MTLQAKNGAPIPLQGMYVRPEIFDFCAEVTVNQLYCNAESVPIEAEFRLPLHKSASICHFQVVLDQKKIVAQVVEKQEARQRYDDAIAEGHAGFLLESRPKSSEFHCSVGNILPGQIAEVTFKYVTELQASEEKMIFELPTTVAPFVRGRVEYALQFEALVHSSVPFKELRCPTHEIVAEPLDENRNAKIRLRDLCTALDRALVLEIYLGTQVSVEPAAWEEKDGKRGTRAAVLSVYPRPDPDMDLDEITTELVFVVDRSGSMSGSRIEACRKTLGLFLHSLPPSSKFNIIGFGSRFEKLFPESAAYSEETLQQATRHAQTMQADLGGTELLPVLRALFAETTDPRFPRQIFVLTDGETSNTDECFIMAREHAKDARVWTVGIGSGCSQHLCSGLAQAGGGECVFVRGSAQDGVERMVMGQLTKALVPAFVLTEVRWANAGTLQATQSPPAGALVRPVFPGDRLLVYALWDPVLAAASATETPAPTPDAPRVTLRGYFGTHEIRIETELKPLTGATADACPLVLHRLAAHGIIDELQKDAANKDTVVQLGTAYTLATKHTSFLAVAERENAEEGEAGAMEHRPVPVGEPIEIGGGGDDFGGVLLAGRVPLPGDESSDESEDDEDEYDAPAAFYVRPRLDPLVPRCLAGAAPEQPMERLCAAPSPMNSLMESLSVRRRDEELACECACMCDSEPEPEPEEEECCNPLCECVSPPIPPQRRQQAQAQPSSPPPPGPQSSRDELGVVVGLQSITGAWSWSTEALAVIRLDETRAGEHAEAHWAVLDPVAAEERDAVRMTLLVLAYLAVRHAGRATEWSLVARKARAFVKRVLTAHGLDAALIAGWVDGAKTLF